MSVGVIVTRQETGDAHGTVTWYPSGTLLNAGPDTAWRLLRRAGPTTTYLAATLSVELHRKEAAAYKINLEAEPPLLYVVVRDAWGDAAWPIVIHLVTASPHEAQAYGMIDGEHVTTLAMPEALIDALGAVVSEHFVDEPFRKRQRVRAVEPEAHVFGQEPIVELRRRQRGGTPGDGHD